MSVSSEKLSWIYGEKGKKNQKAPSCVLGSDAGLPWDLRNLKSLSPLTSLTTMELRLGWSNPLQTTAAGDLACKAYQQ